MNEQIKRQRRNNAIWYMYAEVGYRMQDIADIFKISKALVHLVLTQEAKRRKKQLKNYYK